MVHEMPFDEVAPGLLASPQGLLVGELLAQTQLSIADVLAGRNGLGRVVRRLNVMTVPDIDRWVKRDEFLLATRFPLPWDPKKLSRLLRALNEKGVAALGVKLIGDEEGIFPEVLQLADELDFPFIRIPEIVAFDDILSEALTLIANRQAAVLARSDEIHKSFVNIALRGEGLDEIVDRLAQIIASPVLALNDAGQISAHAVPLEWSESADTWAADAMDLTILDEQPKTGDARLTMISKQVCAVVPIMAGALFHGWLVAIQGAESFGRDTLIALERAATVAALDATKQLALTSVERHYESNVLHELVIGRLTDPRSIERSSRDLGWALDRSMAILVVEFDDAAVSDAAETPAILGSVHEQLAQAWRFVVRNRDREAAVAAFAHEFVAIVGAPPATENLRDLTLLISADLLKATRRTHAIGISRVINNIDGAAKAYSEAGQALHVGRRLWGPSSVVSFEELGIFRLLSLIQSDDELRSFAEEALGPLLSITGRERDRLLKTLNVLIESNLNMSRTANTLNVHYNTIRHRVARIEALIGPLMTDTRLLLKIAIGLQIVQTSVFPGAMQRLGRFG